MDTSSISCSHEYLLDLMPYPASIKCADGTYVGANKVMSNLCGFKDPKKMIGCRDTDLKCPAADMSDIFIAEDIKTIKKNIINKTVDICTYSDNKIHICLSTKRKIIDSNNKAFVFLLINELTEEFMKNKIFITKDTPLNQQISFNIGRYFPETTLSVRESECYYYLLRGYTAKETAKALGSLSNRTVESHIDSIKLKLKCSTKRNLIDYGFSNKLTSFIPESLL